MESNSSLQNPPPQNVLVFTDQNQGANIQPPPPNRRNINPGRPKYERFSRRSFCRCMWCCYCCIFFSLAAYIFALSILYAKYAPKIPLYEVDQLSVKAFNILPDNNSLVSNVAMTIKAKNRNKYVGLMNGGGGRITISYSDADICSGKLNSFYLPGKNETLRTVVLKGNSPFGSELQQALIANEQAGKIPLLFRMEAPVSYVLGDFPLKTVDIYVNCSMVVDSLSPNKDVRILRTQYMYNLKFNWY